MVTIYYGVFCASCKSFIQLGSYEAESLGKNLLDVAPNLDKIQCSNCFEKWLYQKPDIAHSLWSDGRAPIYPTPYPRRPSRSATSEATSDRKTGT